MATLKEMSNVIDSIPIDSPIAYGVQPSPRAESKHYLRCDLRCVMINAEEEGMFYKGGYGAYNEPCTFWIVGDYIITYLTDNLEFNAGMLSEDMMDDLIIEER
jgi:hypothetical protein